MKSGLGYHMWEVKTEDYELPFQKVGIALQDYRCTANDTRSGR